MNCKPNDLAVVISNRHSDNVGAFVRVRRIEIRHPELGAFWAFDSASKPLKLGGFGEAQYHFVEVVETTLENKAYLRDEDLRPIRGVPQPIEEKIDDSVHL